MSVRIGIIGGSGLYSMAELTDREEVSIPTPFGDPSVPYVIGRIAGEQVAFLASPRARAPASSLRAELPRQHLRVQDFGRRADPVGKRGRQPQGTIPAARYRRARSVSGSHARAGQHVLRARSRRSRVVRASRMRAAQPDARRFGRKEWVRRCIEGEPTSAWRVRSSRRWPNRCLTDHGGWTSSG